MADKIVRGYLANQFGFSETGRESLKRLIIPKIEEIGITVINPFDECAKMLDPRVLEQHQYHSKIMELWEKFSKNVTPTNNNLMQKSDCMLAILDGGHAVDDGVSSEIGYYAGIRQGPIFALRSDFRTAENPWAPINSQVLGYILQSEGTLVYGENALNRWFEEIRKWYNNFSRT